MSKEITKSLILLVEDSEDDAFFFNHTLEKSGLNCSLRHVVNGAEAIDLLGAPGHSLPQIIFLDLKMPIVNGFEVLEWMRANAFSAVPVVVLSGSEHEEDKARAARLGATDYLVKPVKVADLQRFLGDVCASKVGVAV